MQQISSDRHLERDLRSRQADLTADGEQPNLTATLVRHSECPTCPPWIVRCSHFDGSVISLGSRDAVTDEQARKTWLYAYEALSGYYPKDCEDDGCPDPNGLHWVGISGRYRFDSLLEAEAAFTAAVERLLAEGGAL